MQRNLLKITLIFGIALLLIAAPLSNAIASGNTTETDKKTTAQEQDSDSASQINEFYYVNAKSSLKMRSGPSTNSDVIGLLPYKTKVMVTGITDSGWYEIEYSNQSGYVSADYLTKASEWEADIDTDNAIDETGENALSTETSNENTPNTFGATRIITALITAIIIMIVLTIFTAYSFLKKGNESCDEFDDDIEADNEYDDEHDDDIEAEYEHDDYEYDDEQ